MAAYIRGAAGSGRSNCHDENLFPCASRGVRGCNRRVFHNHADTGAGVCVVVSSRLGVAFRLALRLARLLLGATGGLRRCSARCCRSAPGRLCAATRCSRPGLGPATLEWPILGPWALGMMHRVGRSNRARSEHARRQVASCFECLVPRLAPESEKRTMSRGMSLRGAKRRSNRVRRSLWTVRAAQRLGLPRYCIPSKKQGLPLTLREGQEERSNTTG